VGVRDDRRGYPNSPGRARSEGPRWSGGRIRPPAQPHHRAPYDAARRALSAAVAIDEVKDILDKSIAMEVYVYQSGDAELMAWSAELKKRSGRRLGELMLEERVAGKLAKGSRSPKIRRERDRPA
jgi:hypothetical protein